MSIGGLSIAGSRRELPIVICGMSRSGTTLLGEILSAHPDICIADEALLQSALSMCQFNPLALELDMAEVRRAVRGLLGVHFAAFAKKQGARRFGDKVPDGMAAAPVDQLFAGECLFLWMVRHPLDRALSAVERWDPETYFKKFYPQEQERTVATLMRFQMRNFARTTTALQQFRAAHPSRVHVCRYEDLVTNPVPALRAIHDFLGETFHDAQLSAAFGDKRREVVHGDLKFNQSSGVHNQSIGRWKGVEPHELNQYAAGFHHWGVAAFMNYLGYTAEYDELCTRAPAFAAAHATERASET